MTDDAARTELPPVSPRRWVRGVRVGVSVFFGLLTVVPVVLWIRGYYRYDIVTFGVSPGPGYMFGFTCGELSVARFEKLAGWVSSGWHAWTNSRNPEQAWANARFSEFVGLRYGSFFVAVPFAYVVMLTIALTASPWPRWRFSIRTMLTITTLVAVVLGAMVWAAAG
jgi:hypothetical protein